jgi:hypothetical protein
MSDAREKFNESRTRGFATADAHDVSWTESSSYAESKLERFTTGPEFEAFTTHLRRAAHVLTVADFMRLRRHYDAAWYGILGDL